jgi:hypothetical protein
MLEIKINCVFDATDNLLSAISSLTGGRQVPGDVLIVEPARETPREIASETSEAEPGPATQPAAGEVEKKPIAPEKATAAREKSRPRARAARETAPPATTVAPEEAKEDDEAVPPEVVATPPPAGAKEGETGGTVFEDLPRNEQLDLLKELTARIAKAGKVREIRALLDALDSERTSALDPSNYQTLHSWLNRLNAGERVEDIVKSRP